MPFNGLGQFDLVYNWQVDQSNGILVRADRMDTQEQDMASGLTNCITKDGQTPITANIPFGGFKLQMVGTGAVSTDGVNYGQVFTSPSFSGTVTLVGLTGSGAINFSSATSVTVPTASVGDNSPNAASTEFVNAVAFSSALPAISAATNDLSIVNDGVVASWGVPRNSASRIFTFRNF